jgi:hypothetical protein
MGKRKQLTEAMLGSARGRFAPSNQPWHRPSYCEERVRRALSIERIRRTIDNQRGYPGSFLPRPEIFIAGKILAELDYSESFHEAGT